MPIKGKKIPRGRKGGGDYRAFAVEKELRPYRAKERLDERRSGIKGIGDIREKKKKKGE